MKEPPQRSDSVIDLEHRFRQTDLEAAIDDSGAYGANVASSALPSFLLQLLAPFFQAKITSSGGGFEFQNLIAQNFSFPLLSLRQRG